MIKNAEKNKHSEEQKNSPYSRLIKVFKDIPEPKKENTEKYSSYTNRTSLISSKKNVNVSNSEEKNKFKIVDKNEIKNEIKNDKNDKNEEIKNISDKLNNIFIQKEYDPNLYYYNSFPDLTSPILFIAIISFHHKKGSIIEYTYPSKEDILKKEKIISYLIDNTGKTKENFIDELFFQLTCVCLPDGIHASNRDTQFFIIHDYKYPLYGISCYEQIKSFRDDTEENTRFSIQKSICIISLLPFYSSLFSKLSICVEAYFNQESLQDKQIINEIYNNYRFDEHMNYNISEMNFIFATRKLLCFTKDKIFMILKMILLEKKILVFSTVSGNVCSFIYNLISLIPGQILFNFKNSVPIMNYLKNLEMYGFPLKIFNENYKLFPLVTLFDIDKIESKYTNYLIGTTNQLILDTAINKKKYDLVINIDTEKIIPFINKKSKDNKNKEIKEPKDTKEMYEISKEEKNIYNSIKEKIKEYDIKYNEIQWLNTLSDNMFNKKATKLIIDGKENNKTNNKNLNNCLNSMSNESLDNFIRIEFENYFKKIFIKLSLCFNIIKNNSLVKLLDISKEFVFTQYILDEKNIKKLFKILLPSSNFVEFLFHYSKMKSFDYWIKEHDPTLYYISENIVSDKILTVFFEDGSVYEGEYKHGKPNGKGSMTSYDNKTIYDGDWVNGKREGIGKLIITDEYNYTGPFENDYFSGSGGVLCDNKGNIYEGDFENGKFEGYGHYKMSNGDTYIGEFKDGIFNGKGQYNDKDGNLFDGEFKNGKKEGQGVLIKKDGEKLEGKFKNDIFLGK